MWLQTVLKRSGSCNKSYQKPKIYLYLFQTLLGFLFRFFTYFDNICMDMDKAKRSFNIEKKSIKMLKDGGGGG